jgi:hypothetical protein
MHLRRLASFLLGVWIASSVLVPLIALHNVRSADRALHSPPLEVRALVDSAGYEKVRMTLRYHAWEQNRSMFNQWGAIQLVLGPIMAVLLFFAVRVNRLAIAVCVAMTTLTAFAHLVVGPEATYLGRAIDFAPGWSGDRVRSYALDALYAGMECLKILLGLGLAGYLFVYKRRRTGATGTEIVPPSLVRDASG